MPVWRAHDSAAVIVDDHVLLLLLLGNEPPDLRPRGATVSTTGLWYHRLCRALADQTVVGVMSKSLGNAESRFAASAVGAVIELPDSVGLLSLRSLGWPMANLLANGVRLNLLSFEALAAAVQLGAEICLGAADHNPPLAHAAAQFGVPVRLIN